MCLLLISSYLFAVLSSRLICFVFCVLTYYRLAVNKFKINMFTQSGIPVYCVWLFWLQVKLCGRGLSLRPMGCTPALFVTKAPLQLRYAACGAI